MHIIDFSDSQTNRDFNFIRQSGSFNDLSGLNNGKAIILSTASTSSLSPFNKSIESIETIQERKENMRCYNEIKDDLYRNHLGKYVVIAKGQLQRIGESFDDVKEVAIDGHHRFIFKVERKEQIKRKTRWPMKRKK